MAQNDRTTGLVGNAGMKVPCRVATTAAIVLSGEQTIDGIAVVTDDRVLVKNQADFADNGVWVVDTGNWNRAPDFDGSYDIVRGSLIHVNEGTVNGTGIFEVTSADPITIGDTDLTFSRMALDFINRDFQTAAAAQTIFNLPFTYANGRNTLAVHVNGLKQLGGVDYTETTASRITFTNGLFAGDEVEIEAGVRLGNLAAALASEVAVTDVLDYFIGGTVESVLAEIVESVGADVGNASSVLVNGASDKVQRWNTPLTADRTATLSVVNAKDGSTFWIIRSTAATGAFKLSVGALITLNGPGEWCKVSYDATTAAWVLVAYGRFTDDGRPGFTDVGDAAVTLRVGSSTRLQRWNSALTAERAATLSVTDAAAGARFRLVRTEAATGNFPLIITGAAQLIRLAPGQWAEVEYSGAAWLLSGHGELRQGKNTALIVLHDDFLGEEIDGFRWQSLVGSDGSCRNAVVLADQNRGVVRLSTGAGAGATMAVNGTQANSKLNWRADLGCFVWEARVALSAITNVAVFIGLTDQVAALEMPFTLAAGDVLTSNATDAVGVLFDTGADTDVWWLVGVANDVDAAKQSSALAPVAATFETWRIELTTGGVATFYRNGTLIGAAMAGAVTPTVLLTPVVAAFARAAAGRDIDVDEITIQAQR